MDTPLFTFGLIADTHTRPRDGDLSSPWQVNELANDRARNAVARMNQHRPEFVIHLGDVVHPVPVLPTYGTAAEEANEILAALEAPLHVIPGNHDVGDKPFPANPAGMVDEAGIALYTRHFGPPFSSFDHRDCRFVLINAPVVNSGLDSEREQRAWLEATLASAGDRRVFLCSHYPPFVMAPEEPSNYDNLDEPGRTWLLRLLREHRVEALFAGHVHHFFYHRYGTTDCYLLPATSFVRQDYAELFRVEPAAEYGRNDADKLGYFTVEVHEQGHLTRAWRTAGETLARGERLERPVASAGAHPRERRPAPVGVHLRHPWAEVTELPYNGPMDEFHRKRVRNDYTLQALWETGVRKLRLTAADLEDARVCERARLLRDNGHELTVFTFGAPAGAEREAIVAERDIVDRIEVVIPWDHLERVLPELGALRELTGLPVLLSKMESSAEKHTEGSKFSHFVSYGFKAHEAAVIEDLMQRKGVRDALTGLVFRVGLDASPSEDVPAIARLCEQHAVEGVVNIRLASDNPAEYVDDDHRIANLVAETLCLGHADRSLALYLDTFIDLDRGYFPRHGLYDRRLNPRPAAWVYRHLQARLSAYRELEVERVERPGASLLRLRADGEPMLVLLSHHPSGRPLLVSPDDWPDLARAASCVDLVSGQVRAMTPGAGPFEAHGFEPGRPPLLLTTREV